MIARIRQWFDFTGSAWAGHDPEMRRLCETDYEEAKRVYGWAV